MRSRGRHAGGFGAVVKPLGLGLSLGLLAMALVTGVGCAEPPYVVAPQNPGDHCRDVCPEGMTCAVPLRSRGEPARPGTCVLLDGRCATSADCGSSGTCVRTSPRLGLCAPSPPHL